MNDFYYRFIRPPSKGELAARFVGRLIGCALFLALFLGVIAAVVWVVATVWRLT